MLEVDKTYQAPPNSGQVILGRTLPSLLDEACDRAPNAQAFNQSTEAGWQPLSNQAFREAAEAVALGLLDLGLERGDRVALLMHSDVQFCIVDMGCLLANLVDVPIDLTQTLEQIIFVLQHSEAKALVISNLDWLTQLEPYLWDTPVLQSVIVIDVPPDWQQPRSQQTTTQFIPIHFLHATNQDPPAYPLQGGFANGTPLNKGGRGDQCRGAVDKNFGIGITRSQDKSPQFNNAESPESAYLAIPTLLHPSHSTRLVDSPIPQRICLVSLATLQSSGQAQISATQQRQLRASLTPTQLATIVYIPDHTGLLQGVMLTHENLSANAIASFSGIPGLQRGDQEVVLSFLPLNHVLARSMLYGHMQYGHSIYFSTPTRVMKHLKEIQPTVLTTVPLLLEKIYSKILEKGNKSSILGRLVFRWALQLAKRYELGCSPGKLSALLLKLADWLVLSKWRSLFGGRIRYLICGGAALNAELVNAFAAAGVPILHGYGLTQASAVVCCNRGAFNRAGTVGVPIAGTEVAIAQDSEILVRGPCVTLGYYKNSEATQELIDPQGWLHTGDLGTFTNDGFLKITGIKKALFKLSTGKYIVPQPIENRLNKSPFVSRAIVVGAERKYCAMLIIPNLEALHSYALEVGINLSGELLLKHPCITALYQALVDQANCHLPYWATVKRFQIINTALISENELLTSTGQVDRAIVNTVLTTEINALYQDAEARRDQEGKGVRGNTLVTPLSSPSSSSSLSPQSASACPTISTEVCPTYAQSLNPRLTT